METECSYTQEISLVYFIRFYKYIMFYPRTEGTRTGNVCVLYRLSAKLGFYTAYR
ncbi:unnamed protein product [Acanthoscelides obtectus]|uniref:Uncharacterized protein n=1 Tax=Acanthoscelides obtectus TaxID=200917 RepID=A0A9P0Q391_ACAOB|nr:unnamed protein product [Acanthoscelides obtectus]CAK1685181.1 hypothetical protein AOBTE_LOCUS35250 [Acanthoscelides obtectus]